MVINEKKKSIAIIGGGASALFLAALIDSARYSVTIYEKNKSLGRKFLVAGKGGFNLTHSEDVELLIDRYTPTDFLKEAISIYNNEYFVYWLQQMGMETYVGSSRRIFPIEGIKPIDVLTSIVDLLKKNEVQLVYEQEWKGWNEEGALMFNKDVVIKSDYCVYALGGGSWKVTGSAGDWLDRFSDKGIATLPFRSSNCGFGIEWPDVFINKCEGLPLKNIALRCRDIVHKGEVVITKFGLEGNAIYAISGAIQNQLATGKHADIFLDLKPVFTEEQVLDRLTNSKSKNTTDRLRKDLKLSKTQINILKAYSNRDEFLSPELLAAKIKNLPLVVLEAAPLDEAISTLGGIALTEVDANFEFLKMKHHYCIGEMLDWNAPTGGYLLQGCFSMGAYLAKHLNQL